jgi:hypothetical protein
LPSDALRDHFNNLLDSDARANEIVCKQTLERVRAAGWRVTADKQDLTGANLLAALEELADRMKLQCRQIITTDDCNTVMKSSGCKVTALQRTAEKADKLMFLAKKALGCHGPQVWILFTDVDGKRPTDAAPTCPCIALVVPFAEASELEKRHAALAAALSPSSTPRPSIASTTTEKDGANAGASHPASAAPATASSGATPNSSASLPAAPQPALEVKADQQRQDLSDKPPAADEDKDEMGDPVRPVLVRLSR